MEENHPFCRDCFDGSEVGGRRVPKLNQGHVSKLGVERAAGGHFQSAAEDTPS